MSAAKDMFGGRGPGNPAWQRGVSGNPSGRPKLSEELRAIKAMHRDEIGRVIAKYARMSGEDLVAAVADAKLPGIDLAIAKILVTAIATGDHQKLAFLLDRSIGKPEMLPPDPVDIEIQREIESLSDKELVQLIKAKLPELEAPT